MMLEKHEIVDVCFYPVVYDMKKDLASVLICTELGFDPVVDLIQYVVN